MKDCKILLAIETSQRGSVSLFRNGQDIAHWLGNVEKSRSEDLLPQIQSLMKKAEISKTSIDCIAVSTGPGSFTGLRVGIAIAKGLSNALNCPLIGIPIMEAIASARRGENVISILNAGRGHLYWQEFGGRGTDPVIGPQLIELEGVKAKFSDSINTTLIVEKDFLDKEPTFFADMARFANILAAPLNLAGLVGTLALEKMPTTSDNYAELVPLYVRNVDAKLPTT